jgi:thioredoxin reductase (NADPH)
VDDDPQVRNAVKRDLRSKYAATYRVIDAGSGAEALEVTAELKSRDDTVALFLVDQRMPDMNGTEFLVHARDLYADAKRVLLTAYADTDAAISAINEVDLDHYLMKPWDPPELQLYPVLDDLLDDWWANTPPPYDGIRVVGTRWSPATYEVKDFFARNQLPYRFFDVERDPEAEAIVRSGSGEVAAIPVVLFPDGTRLVAPDRRALAEQAGLQTEADSPFYDLIIVGGGPAGLAAGVYGASEGLRTVMIEQAAPGGQAGTSSRIENYLGFPAGISGGDLARRAVTQASRLGG